MLVVQEFPFLSKKNFIHFWFMVVCMKQEITENPIYIQWLQCLMASYMGKKTQGTKTFCWLFHPLMILQQQRRWWSHWKHFLVVVFDVRLFKDHQEHKNPHPRSVFLSGLSSRASVIQQFGIEAKMHGCAMGRNPQEDNFQHDRIILFNNHFTCLNQCMIIDMKDYECQ